MTTRAIVCLLALSVASLHAEPALLESGRPGVTALMMAAFSGSAQVGALLKAGARVDDAAADGMTPLLFASLRGSPSLVAQLLDAGASIKARNRNGMSALLLASEYNPDRAVVSLLLARGASLADRDVRGRTPLMAAAGRNNFEVVETLLAAGADPKAVDNKNRTAAAYAQFGNPKLAGTPTFWALYERQY